MRATSPAAISERSVVLDGRRYTYREAGDMGSPALVALHGLISHAGAWDDLAAGLADRRRVLSLDQRGHGGSEWSTDYSQQAWIDDVGLFADELGLARSDLIGHSMGGRIAFLYAARHPERVRRLVIVDIAPMKPGPWPPAPGASFATLDEALQAAREPRYVPARDELFQRFITRNLMPMPDGRWTWRCDPRLRAAPATEPGFAASVEEQWAALRALVMPTLVIATEHNRLQAPDRKREMAAAIARGRFLEIKETGHDVLLEQPEALIAAVRDFLAEEEATR